MFRYRRKTDGTKIAKNKRLKRFRSDISKTLGAILIATGVLFVTATPAYYWYNNLVAASEETLPEKVDEPIEIDQALFNIQPDEDRVPQKVIIPSLNIDISLKQAKVIKGRWEVFEDSGSYGVGSALPGQTGNTVIFAHARERLFLPLKLVQKDMKVYVLTQQGWFDYKVTDIKEVQPYDVSVIKTTEDETLTMYTCSGFADSKRLIVVAKRV